MTLRLLLTGSQADNQQQQQQVSSALLGRKKKRYLTKLKGRTGVGMGIGAAATVDARPRATAMIQEKDDLMAKNDGW